MLVAAFTAVLVVAGAAVLATDGPSVDPVLIAGNPTCAGLGYDFGFKPQPEPPPSGTYTFPNTTDTFTIISDGTLFDWTSTLGVDAVIVKGGPNGNAYIYDPPQEAFGDSGLSAPTNPNNGLPFAISHIEVCYDFELDVSKTAETTFTRTFAWDIDKSVTPSAWDLFTGDTGTSLYTVAVTKSGFTDSDWAVTGEITIANNTPFDANLTAVSDVITPSIGVVADCGVTLPYSLPAGATLSCTYASALPDGSPRTNEAAVATDGVVKGGNATAAVTFGDPTTVVNGSIDVNDSNGGSWTFSDSGSVAYERTFACDGDEGTHENTATIVQTGQSDSASVTVTCHELTVTKTAATSFDRRWTWEIDKSADQNNLVLSDGQLFAVNYTVSVSPTGADGNHLVSGTITIANPNPAADAALTGVADVVSPDIAATVACPSSTVPSGGTLECTYTANVPDGSDRTNTATATLQNHAYASDGTATPAGTSGFTGSASVTFGDPATETDECLDVSDTNVGLLGTVCADGGAASFPYALIFGRHADADVYLECGSNAHPNTASFVTNDTATVGDDSWTVAATVACEAGCTLTPGYWKTHSENGPAPYDDTWAMLSGGADTPFFVSGASYHQVLWTAPHGNAYYILAHAYIAAELNGLNGASSPTDVAAAFDSATVLFGTYTPEEVALLKGKVGKETRDRFIALAGLLDAYNNGLTGPGHCSE
jgi:hypothetical protein